MVVLCMVVASCHRHSNGPPSTTLSGCPGVGYWSNVSTGSGQTFQMAVDIASPATGVAAQGCIGCNGLMPLYDPGASAVPDGMGSVSYPGGGGWSGPAFQDSVNVPGSGMNVALDFVAISSLTISFSSVDCNGNMNPNLYQGVLGLGPSQTSGEGPFQFLPLYATATSQSASFSMQLCDSGGSLWLSNVPATKTPLQFTPMVTSNWFAVNLANVAIGQTTVGSGTETFGAVVLESQSPFSTVPQATFNAMLTALQTNSAFNQLGSLNGDWYANGECQPLTPGLLAQLPTMTLTFPSVSGSTFNVERAAEQSYLFPQSQQGATVYCPAIIPDSLSSLGASMLNGLVVQVDESGNQVGFTVEACPGTASGEATAAM
jgi:hypothetical protein